MFKSLFKKQNDEKTIVAPMNGEVVSLENVPDPVFSQKMMGEGIAIKPTAGEVVAPIDGEIVQVAPTKHAIGLQAKDGTELLIHVGLETVALDGKGFSVKVNTGDQVTAGQTIMEVDLEYIREHAKDTVTPIVITNSSTSEKEYTVTESETICKAGETVLVTY